MGRTRQDQILLALALSAALAACSGHDSWLDGVEPVDPAAGAPAPNGSPAGAAALTEPVAAALRTVAVEPAGPDSPAPLLARTRGATMFFTESGLAVALSSRRSAATAHDGGRSEPAAAARRGWALSWELVGARAVAPRAEGPLGYRVNRLLGPEEGWQQNLPTWSRVVYDDIYPGVSMIVEPRRDGLEYRFVLAPGTDPSCIRLHWRGPRNLRVVDQGAALELDTALGTIRETGLRAYLEEQGTQRDVAVSYLPAPSPGGNGDDGYDLSFGFADPSGPASRTARLVIDPLIDWSSLLGGGQGADGLEDGYGIAVDSAGAAYVVGETTSWDFPTTTGAFDDSYSDSLDVVVSKVDPSGASLVYSTYLGGSADDQGYGIAVDTMGAAYVTGITESSDFPTTAGAFDEGLSGASDTFVTKLDPSGTSLAYSTYLGGTSDGDVAHAIAVDDAGSAYVTGHACSSSFPTTPGAFDEYAGEDGFVTKLDPTGAALVYSTGLGGHSGKDHCYGIAVDSSGYAYVTGSTESSYFPTTQNAYDKILSGAQDAFVTKVSAWGGFLVYSSYLGGTGDESGHGIAVSSSGTAYVTGQTDSSNFPTTTNAYDKTANGAVDAFVTIVHASGNSLYRSSYLGGTGDDVGQGIGIDAAGQIFVTGHTESADFPMANPIDATLDGTVDGFVSKLDAAVTSLAASTYLGGSYDDYSRAVAVDGAGQAIVTGVTTCSDFPTTVGAFDTILGGTQDAFVTKLDAAGTALAYSTLLGGQISTAGADEPKAIAVDDAGFVYVAGRTLSSDFPTTLGAFTTDSSGGFDAFVTKVDASGASLVWSTLLGGTLDDAATGIAIDDAGHAVVTGGTRSLGFPTTVGALDTIHGGSSDAFVTKLDPSGASLTWSTLLGGGDYDHGHGLALDGAGYAYLTGETWSTNFPTTSGAFATSLGGAADAYVAKLAPSGATLVWSTFLGGPSPIYPGGSAFDGGRAIAVDDEGSAYVTGDSHSLDFPTTPYSFDPSPFGYQAFVTKLDATGSSLVYSGKLGYSSWTFGRAIAVNHEGQAYVTGWTNTNGFPTWNGYDKTFDGDTDAFVLKIHASGSQLLWSTFFGGSGWPGRDYGNGIAVDGAGHAYVTGRTTCTDLPTTPGAFDTTLDGAQDGFVAKFGYYGSLYWSTYLGGSDDDTGGAIAVDDSGLVWVTGETSSTDFPTTIGAFDTSADASPTGFVTRIDDADDGSPCTSDGDCLSGICEDGICCAVACGLCSSCDPTGTSCTVVPPDDDDCGVIDCDGLDTACRDYQSLSSGRCEGAGDCKDANDVGDCTDYANSDPTVTCRPAVDGCDVAELCDGLGACPADGFATAGSSCGDPADDACTDPDTCDGQGACLDNHEPPSTTCRPAVGDCDVAESCDGLGGCPADDFATVGSSCGDLTDDACTDPDTCDGQGACLDHHEPPSTTCRPAVDACDVAELCDGLGACPADGFAPAGMACGDPTADACTEPDVCDSEGMCLDKHAPAGTACDDGDACTQTDTCEAGACGGVDPIECVPLDECHDAGTCDPQTGDCTNPSKPNGSPCSDGTCKDGSCGPGAGGSGPGGSEPGGSGPGGSEPGGSGPGGAGSGGDGAGGSATGGTDPLGGASAPPVVGQDEGCSCRAAGQRSSSPLGGGFGLLALGVVVWLRRTKGGSTSSHVSAAGPSQR